MPTRALSLAMVCVTASLLLFEPTSVAAADCSKELAAIAALEKELLTLGNELTLDHKDLDAAEADLASAISDIDSVQASLAGESDRVKAELESHGLWAAAKSLGIQVALSIALAAAGPEGWALLGETLAAVFEAAEKIHTAYEVAQLVNEAGEASIAMDDLAAGNSNHEELSQFAKDNNLTEMSFMLSQEDRLADLSKTYDAAWNRLQKAAARLIKDQALLDGKSADLKAAFDAFYACRAEAGPVPSACEGQATNPNGAGVCR